MKNKASQRESFLKTSMNVHILMIDNYLSNEEGSVEAGRTGILH